MLKRASLRPSVKCLCTRHQTYWLPSLWKSYRAYLSSNNTPAIKISRKAPYCDAHLLCCCDMPCQIQGMLSSVHQCGVRVT